MRGAECCHEIALRQRVLMVLLLLFVFGAGIASFITGTDIDVALYVGDDATDLDAFRALGELAADGRLQRAIRVGVRSEEGPSEITSEADLVVDGTAGVQSLLAMLTAD